MEQLPPSLAVIGAGAVGCELAQAFARLGTQVALIEAADRILPQEDIEASDVVSRRFEGEGIKVLVGQTAQSVSGKDDAEGVSIRLPDGGSVEAAELLVAVGRRPNIDGLGLETAGVTVSRSGIVVDIHLRTTNRTIYGAGDVTGGAQFTHYAGWQGFMAVRNAFLPMNSAAVRDTLPRATFTDPVVAQTGLTEEQATELHGSKALATRWPLDEVDRALTAGETDGFVKAVHLASGKVLGATIACSRADDMLQEWTLAIDKGIKLGDLARSIHVYPAYSMAAQQLALRAEGRRLFFGRLGRILRWFARRG